MNNEDNDDGPWGVFLERCEQCGLPIAVVATVESVEEGYAEIYRDLRCSTCKYRTTASLN